MIPDDGEFFQASRCNKCGKIEAYHRLGCRCTPSWFEDQDITYGYFDRDMQFGDWEDAVTSIAMKMYAEEILTER